MHCHIQPCIGIGSTYASKSWWYVTAYFAQANGCRLSITRNLTAQFRATASVDTRFIHQRAARIPQIMKLLSLEPIGHGVNTQDIATCVPDVPAADGVNSSQRTCTIVQNIGRSNLVVSCPANIAAASLIFEAQALKRLAATRQRCPRVFESVWKSLRCLQQLVKQPLFQQRASESDATGLFRTQIHWMS